MLLLRKYFPKMYSIIGGFLNAYEYTHSYIYISVCICSYHTGSLA